MCSNTPLSDQLELRIFTNSVGLYSKPPANIIESDAHAASVMMTHPPPNSTSSDTIQLLSGPIDDFLLFSRQEHSKWLIDITHDLCDPLAQRGSLCIWAGQEWRTVAHTEPLTASIYLYAVPEGVVVSLSKISARDGKSKTSTSGEANTMANLVNDRDGHCWITDSPETLVNGHLCPKRMGDHLARVVFDTFVAAPHSPARSIYDERFGISLLSSLDGWFDDYELGLRIVSTNQYECHSFGSPPPNYIRTIFCTLPLSATLGVPVLHGHRISPPRPEQANNPPPGLFRWHYLQCVIKRFAQSDYRNLENIHYMELPLRMKGDSDDQGTDSELEWPSAILDRGRAMQATIEQERERQRFVADWTRGS